MYFYISTERRSLYVYAGLGRAFVHKLHALPSSSTNYLRSGRFDDISTSHLPPPTSYPPPPTTSSNTSWAELNQEATVTGLSKSLRRFTFYYRPRAMWIRKFTCVFASQFPWDVQCVVWHPLLAITCQFIHYYFLFEAIFDSRIVYLLSFAHAPPIGHGPS